MDTSPPLLHRLTVYGNLTFLDNADKELKVENMVVHGHFGIGTKAAPFKHRATISVYGNRTTGSLVVSNNYHLGNKAIANFGSIHLYGRAPNMTHAKLGATTAAGDTDLRMATPVDWKTGDRIVVTGTEHGDNEATTTTGSFSGTSFTIEAAPDEYTSASEEFTITAVSADGLVVSLDKPVAKRHFAGMIDVGPGRDGVSQTVQLRASVGHLSRGIVVQGVVEPGCTNAQYRANQQAYADNCQGQGLVHHVCKERGHVPVSCSKDKGYGLTIMVGDLRYSDGSSRAGTITAEGVEFVNLGKLNTTHKGFSIHYQGEYAASTTPNVVDRCVFRHSWHDGITTARVSGLRLTRNVIHRTLGHGINIGEEFLDWGKDNKPFRSRRRTGLLRQDVPAGDGHTVNLNLVVDSFKRRMLHGSPNWLSGIMARQEMASFKGNVVSGSYWAGITVRTQDAPFATTHTIDNNEAFANKYGAILRSSHHAKEMEFYGFKGWANSRGGIVGFDERSHLTIRKAVLADNHFGFGLSFVEEREERWYEQNQRARVMDSVIMGVSAATDTSGACPDHRIGLMLPRWSNQVRCEALFGPCRGCSIVNNVMDQRYGNFPTGNVRAFHVSDTTFACVTVGVLFFEIGV